MIANNLKFVSATYIWVAAIQQFGYDFMEYFFNKIKEMYVMFSNDYQDDNYVLSICASHNLIMFSDAR